jgi:hypothetical protein
MMRVIFTAALLSIAGGACAQGANEGIKGLEACFQAARLADTICASPANDSVQRLDCFQKARTAQLECLQHVPSGMSADPKAPENPKEAGTRPPERAPGALAVPPDRPNATTQTKEAAAPASSISPPAETIPPESPTGTIPNQPAGAVSPEPSPAPLPSESATANVSLDKPVAAPAPSAETPDLLGKSPDTNWVVSETTSPVDYSALVTATIHSVTSPKDAPSTLAFRCRQLRTELSVRTEGAFSQARGAEFPVDYQINDQSPVRSNWTVSADRKTLAYKDDTAGLLRSLPEGSTFKITVLDKPGAVHAATFQLTGLDMIRKKIAAACKWTPAQDAFGKR